MYIKSQKSDDYHEDEGPQKAQKAQKETRQSFCAFCAFCGRPLLRPDVHHFFSHERFNLIADFHVVKVLYADAAFVAARDFGSIFLEASERRDLAFENDDVVA